MGFVPALCVGMCSSLVPLELALIIVLSVVIDVANVHGQGDLQVVLLDHLIDAHPTCWEKRPAGCD